MKKLNSILQLATDTQTQISKNDEEWKRFLKSTSKVYKFSSNNSTLTFDDLLLIYAQRPDATICSSIETWNTKLNCWVNRGSKGIAVIDKNSDELNLEYLFDVNDVHKYNNKGKIPYLWEITQDNRESVISSLESLYDRPETNKAFEERIYDVSEYIAEENYQTYTSELELIKEESFLRDFDLANNEVLFKNLLTSSIAYSILSRCNFNTEDYKELLNFDGIYNFNTVETLSQLGCATTICSRQLFSDIGRAIKAFEYEKNKPLTHNNIEKGEKNDEHILSSQRGLHDSRTENGKSTNNRNWKIRTNEKEVSNGASPWPVPEYAVKQQSEHPSYRDKRDGTRTNRPYNGRNEEKGERNRRTEINGSDGLGTNDEQHPTSSGGNSTEGAYSQLSLFPTIQQQIDAIEKGDQYESPFLFGKESEKNEKYTYIKPKMEKEIPEDYIKYIVNIIAEKQGISDIYTNEIDSKIRADFIKKKFGIFGYSWPIDGNGVHGYNTLSRKGFTVYWKDNEGEKEGILSWGATEKRISELFNINEQLDDEVDTITPIIKNTVKENTTALNENAISVDAITYENLESTNLSDASTYKLENFNLRDHNYIYKNDKDKFNCNLEAIKTLKTLELEKRPATDIEKVILSKYLGWGGLPQAFDSTIDNWKSEYTLLKNTLTDDEYKMARASTLNAHYTPPEIIKCIYEKIESLGFRSGNILEPALGSGYFFGLLPDSMKNAKLYGVELDDITGRIAKQLYPNAKIEVTGYEKTTFKDGSFDICIGNVPFGNYKVADKKYDKLNFMIHDYFFAKSLDKVRAGGMIVFITSKGTMDKKNNMVRKYIAQRAELLGAIRLPNNAFLSNAGTEVTSDIIFLKKRDRIIEDNPDWIHLGLTDDNISINQYFIDNPGMILGKMENVSGPFGLETACLPIGGKNLQEQLTEALSSISGEIDNTYLELENEVEKSDSIPADPNVNNFSYVVVNDDVYFRENSYMTLTKENDTALERIKGLITIRDCTRQLIFYQLEEYSSTAIKEQQLLLNNLYDDFTKKYGLINSAANKRAFREDSSYYLLCSLEVLNDDGSLNRKADIFNKRTIKQKTNIVSVDTASDALAVSLSQKASIDFNFMSSLISTHPSEEEIIKSLQGVIFKNPKTDKWETSDEYLSGNVREKLKLATDYASSNPEYLINVEYLKKIQPKDLTASEIDVRLGATWLDRELIKQFTVELLSTPNYLVTAGTIDIIYSSTTGSWNVKGKNVDTSNSIANVTYGTNRINAYKIIEDTLNLKDVKIFDIKPDDNGNEKRELNKKETLLAQQKQELIKEAFKEWIFKTPERREKICKKYNENFNNIRPREYDGKYLTFDGMNPEISLMTHQRNTAARIIYGNNNTLAAHCVGAGKTYMMIAAAMESKRLGLSQKPLFVVPNHLIEQWTNDFLTLYPGANILASTKKDFEPANRKKFCSRIATGDYDAIIIGHSQFEKIPLSRERQINIINGQIEEITSEISDVKANNGERYTIKQMEKTKKSLEVRLEKLNDSSRKDDVVTFEELGVDRLFVDEAHSYKNLFLYTKMRNVAGISQTEAQKSSDMFSKCQYMDEITGGKGIIFATGTPISNSMTELYTMMRYLQYSKLKELGLLHFDAWASTFGETVTANELSPEGTGYRTKTRFAKFYNLPELINIFKETADIQTPDMLNLPIPEVTYKDITTEPSEEQKDYIKNLAKRADRVRNRNVDANIDNMLKITNDGRKLALDQRLINPLFNDYVNSKINESVKNTFDIWTETKPQKLTQLIFCDLSTPKNNKNFNVYDDIKKKLIEKGIPEKEIAFIHDAKTDLQKAELFSKVRKGSIRVLIGSTSKMGAGTNVQNKLVALHHLDVPWKPSDIEQQEGRILRQGNTNKRVIIFRYITKGTFDAYSWQLLENKQKYISQIMTSKSPVRSCEDIDEATLSFAEVKALATGNPYIKEKMDLDIQVSKLKVLKANYLSQKYNLEDKIAKFYPKEISKIKELINGFIADINLYQKANKDIFNITICETTFEDKKDAGTQIIELCKELTKENPVKKIGSYKGFSLQLRFDYINDKFLLEIISGLIHKIELGPDPIGNITRMDNALVGMDSRMNKYQDDLESLSNQLENAKVETEKPFKQEEELNSKLSRLNELDALLNMDDKILENTSDIDKEVIISDLKKNGYSLNAELVDNITKLSEIMGEIKSIKEIKELYKAGPSDSDTSDLIKTIMQDIKLQEKRLSNLLDLQL